MSYNRSLPFNDLPNLPPIEFEESVDLLRHLAKASRFLGELNGLCASLPDSRILINTIVLQESKNSSAIENIVTTQDELYKAATEEKGASNAAKEVLLYRDALYHGLTKMHQQENLILTNTMVEVVQTIKQNSEGIRVGPGTTLVNAISGEIIYTPPCCESILREKLASLEIFINDSTLFNHDPLIKMALIHYQFEAIHPFADGNGRTGRILNALYLVQQQLLSEPVLYLSAYIMKYKIEYYQLLKSVTEKNNWNDWIMYMLSALIETAQQTTIKIKNILLLKNQYENAVKEVLGKSYTYDLLQLMFTLPYLTIELLQNKKLAHRQTASLWLKKLTQAQILRPQKMGKTTYFINFKLIEMLSKD